RNREAPRRPTATSGPPRCRSTPGPRSRAPPRCARPGRQDDAERPRRLEARARYGPDARVQEPPLHPLREVGHGEDDRRHGRGPPGAGARARAEGEVPTPADRRPLRREALGLEARGIVPQARMAMQPADADQDRVLLAQAVRTELRRPYAVAQDGMDGRI